MPAAGTVVRNPAYAAVLERLIAAGELARTTGSHASTPPAAEWRTGIVAERHPRSSPTPHRHSTGTDHAAVITPEDFAAFEASYEAGRDGITSAGTPIAKTPAWGQGPVLLQALRLLDGLEDDRLDPSTELGAHTVLEALKLALADRDAYYGDADVPLDVLLSDAYTDARRALIGDEASREWRPGTVPGREPFAPPLRTSDGCRGEGRAPASRRWRRPARRAATRATSTSWTAGAT